MHGSYSRRQEYSSPLKLISGGLLLLILIGCGALPLLLSISHEQPVSASTQLRPQVLVGEANELLDQSADRFDEASSAGGDLYASTDDDMFRSFSQEGNSLDDLFVGEQEEEQQAHFVTFFSVHTGEVILYSEFAGSEIEDVRGYLTWSDVYGRKFRMKNVPGITHILSERPLSIEDGVVMPSNPVE